MEKKKWIYCLWVLIATMGFLGLCGSVNAAAKEEPIVLKFSMYPPQGDLRVKMVENYARLVSEKTGGRVKIQIYPSESLSKAMEEFEALSSGVIDMAAMNGIYISGKVPELSGSALPFAIKSYDQAHRAAKELGPEMDAILRKQNIKYFWTVVPGAFELFTRSKTVKKMEDFKGLAIRTAGKEPAEAVKLWGGASVTMAVPEMYQALQRGTCDGNLVPMMSYTSMRLQEVAPYATILRWFSQLWYAPSMNLDRWNRLPGDIQKAFLDASGPAMEWAFKAHEEYDAKTLEELKRICKEVYYLPDEEMMRWKATVKPMYDKLLSTGTPFTKKQLEVLSRLPK
jgi:TRAP-type C4-dicarboxylate transport system substrate-binding protein